VKNWRRTAIYTTGLVVLAGTAVSLALHAVVDPERLKRQARDKAKAELGRDLAIADISLQLLPLPMLFAEQVKLSDPDKTKDFPLVTAESVTTHLQLLPLLLGKASISSWTITNARIHYRPKGGASEMWLIEEAAGDALPGGRDVHVEARVVRNKQAVQVTAQFASLAHAGKPGAVTPGTLDLDWGKTHLSIAGSLPLEASAQRASFTATLKSSSIQDLLAFLGTATRATAPLDARVDVRESQGRFELTRANAVLGKHRAWGDAKVTPSAAKAVIDTRIEIGPIDWAQLMLDLGGAPVPPLEGDELFYDRPLAWPLLVALQGSEGSIDLKVHSVVMRNGLGWQNLKAQGKFDGDRLNIASYTTNLLGGSATGSLQLEGRKKLARLNMEATDLLLERWFKERRRNVAFTGGPMKVSGKITASGDSMRDLAGTMTGPVSIRMGPGVFLSKKAGDAEAMMTAFSKRDSTEKIDFECASARLPFASGRARGEGIFGARSAVSLLLTSGTIDMGDESIDLHGRLRPRSGVGFASIAGDVEITGKIREMKMKLDPAGTPAAVARGAAAIATVGLSLLLDSSRKEPDPCEVVFSTKP
jgi:hypothetical protein